MSIKRYIFAALVAVLAMPAMVMPMNNKSKFSKASAQSRKKAALVKQKASKTTKHAIPESTYGGNAVDVQFITDARGKQVRIVVIQDGDLVKQKVDNVVIPTTTNLALTPTLPCIKPAPHYALVRKVFNAAGPQLLAHVQQKKMMCEMGDVRATPAFNLNKQGVELIIHAHGITGNVESHIMQRAYGSAILLATQNNARSLALPCININSKKSAQLVVDAVVKMLSQKQCKNTLKEIRFLVSGENNFINFVQYVKQLHKQQQDSWSTYIAQFKARNKDARFFINLGVGAAVVAVPLALLAWYLKK